MNCVFQQAKTLAEQRAEKLHAKLNYQPKADEEGKDEEQAMETFRKYEEELEINDFPQQARWKVTSKVRFKLKITYTIFKILNSKYINLTCICSLKKH